MTYRVPIYVGDRVALAPHLDLWMAGCRYGTVTSSLNRDGRWYAVRLDTGPTVMLKQDELLGAVGPINKTSLSDGPKAEQQEGNDDVLD